MSTAKENPPAPADAAVVKKVKQRSPNYPCISLKHAMPKVMGLYEQFKRNWIPVGVAHQRWEYKAHSGAGNQVVAALKAYGLIDIQGNGEERQIRISDRSFQIAQNHKDQPELKEKGMLYPAIHAELWTKYKDDGLPADDLIRHYLVFDKKFNPDVVDDFIVQFRETISFSGLASSDKIDKANASEDTPRPIALGDYIQWESQGALQFPEARRVISVSDDGDWLFVAESATGIPAAQAIHAEAPNGANSMNPTTLVSPPPNPAFVMSGMKQDTFTTESGEVVLRWPGIMTAADYADFQGWIDMMKGKILRAVKDPENIPKKK